MNKTILVVDDYIGSVSMLQTVLKERGYSVITAMDGEEAVTKAKIMNPDLIVLDIVLPKIEGTEVARILSQDSATKNIPIFFITGIISEEENPPFIQGAHRLFPKPINYEELLTAIKHTIGESQS